MIKTIITTMLSPIVALWRYFKDMNSERGGGVSIKRNIAWGIASLVVFVQVFSLIALYYLIIKHGVENDLIGVFKYLCVFYVIVDAVMILLVLQITSVEKLKSLAQTVVGSHIGMKQYDIPAMQDGEKKKEKEEAPATGNNA